MFGKFQPTYTVMSIFLVHILFLVGFMLHDQFHCGYVRRNVDTVPEAVESRISVWSFGWGAVSLGIGVGPWGGVVTRLDFCVGRSGSGLGVGVFEMGRSHWGRSSGSG